MVTSTGLEPVTSRLGILRSIQMSYEATQFIKYHKKINIQLLDYCNNSKYIVVVRF